MARLSTSGVPPPALDTTSINLARMIARLQAILTTPDATTEARLRASSYERERVGANLEYARSLLLRLEQDATNIKVQSRRQETQVDLIRKREQLQGLTERLQELNELASYESHDFTSSEGEDLLGQDTPNETDDQTSNSEDVDETSPLRETTREPTIEPPTTTASAPIPESTLRARSIQTSAPSAPSSTEAGRTTSTQLFPTQTTATTSSTLSTATKESLLTHNRHEQEALTSSMLSMAQALKSSSKAFSDSLDAEKSILDRTTDGLEKNKSGLDAAQKKMGVLRKMSEGRSWWGRMMMYAWIFGLWVVALVIVFVLPKLRF
ncbi:synaptobrevin [Xylogone sp. PMI_703]|nr:synaptobrevin [Xylogone sp. PMI_703]